MQSNIYRVNRAVVDELNIYADITENVRDSNGAHFAGRGPSDPPFKRWHIAPDIDVRSLTRVTLQVGLNQRVADLLGYVYSGTLIMRDRVLKVIDDSQLELCPEIVRVAFDLTDFGTTVAHKHYTMLWPLKYWDCLDYAKSDIEFYSSSVNIVRKVNEWWLDGELVPQFDLFAINETRQWFASERFKQVIESQGFSGFGFEVVNIS